VKKQPLRATGLVAAGVIAGGILAGTLGAQAANETDAAPADGPMIVRGHHGGPHHGPGAPGRPGGEDLAKALGVSEEKLRTAFEAIRDDVKPTVRDNDGPPSKAERAALHDKFTAALAKELGLSEAKVEAAFEKVHKAHAAEHRDALSDRLDAAVKRGKLTKDDKASVLKAFDAGVLGGPGGRSLR
jgi:hypothetical protein